MKTSIESKGKKIEIVTTVSSTKVQAGSGAAPWKIGTTVKTSETIVFVNGEYNMHFPFSHKRHAEGGISAKNQINQLLSYL